MNRLETADQRETQLEQVRVCITIGIECMDPNPKKRPFAHHIVNKLDKTVSIVESGIASPSAEQQVRSLNEQHGQRQTLELSFEYLSKDMNGRAKTEEPMEFLGAFRDHWRYGKEHQWSLLGAQGTKPNTSQQQGASTSRSNSVVLNKLNIFTTKARRNYTRNGGPMLEKIDMLKLFKKEELKPAIQDKNRIGRGVFEDVYIGLVDKVPVIVKKQVSGAVLQNGQFAKEVIMQSQVLHKNIVRLIGCCVEVDIPMLVYEYLSKDTLDDILHNTNSKKIYSWMTILCQRSHNLAYQGRRGEATNTREQSRVTLLIWTQYTYKQAYLANTVMSTVLESLYWSFLPGRRPHTLTIIV
uniref:Protein kinase domain-containing protein n=2 Tax=Triticum urartu TaxID=4572 RepID=A0A8R7QMI3_TRIUA